MNYKVLKCIHCDTQNAVGVCNKCSRYFIITESHVQGQMRNYESAPIKELPGKEVEFCDFCSTQSTECAPAEVVNSGLRQLTCANCHTEFLSHYNLR